MLASAAQNTKKNKEKPKQKKKIIQRKCDTINVFARNRKMRVWIFTTFYFNCCFSILWNVWNMLIYISPANAIEIHWKSWLLITGCMKRVLLSLFSLLKRISLLRVVFPGNGIESTYLIVTICGIAGTKAGQWAAIVIILRQWFI